MGGKRYHRAFFYFKFYLLLSRVYLHVYDVCMNMCPTACICEGQVTTVSSLSTVGPEDQTQVVGLTRQGLLSSKSSQWPYCKVFKELVIPEAIRK